MTRDHLLALADRCEKATGPDRELECRIWCALNGHTFDLCKQVVGDLSKWEVAPAYTASLDAAMTLASNPEFRQFGGPLGLLREAMDRLFRAKADDDALARFLTAASLRALATQAEGERG
jgi:hypothetical protein